MRLMLSNKKKTTRSSQFSTLLLGFKRTSIEEPLTAEQQLFLGHTPSSKTTGG